MCLSKYVVTIFGYIFIVIKNYDDLVNEKQMDKEIELYYMQQMVASKMQSITRLG